MTIEITKIDNWEKEFDEKLKIKVIPDDEENGKFAEKLEKIFWPPVKSFIRSLLSSERSRIKKEITELKREFADTPIDKRGTGFDWLNKLEETL